jgi:hypothetical protein
MLAFRDRSFLVQTFAKSNSTPKNLQKTLPFTYTNPVLLKNLVLSIEPSEPGVHANIEPSDDHTGHVDLKLDTSRLGKRVHSLTCKLTDKQSGKTTAIGGVIAERSRISVLPAIIRFSQSKDGKLKGHAIIARHTDLTEKPTESSETVSVQATCAGKKLRVENRKVSLNLCRASVELPANLSEQLANGEDYQIAWEVLWGSEKSALKSKVFFDQSSVNFLND